MDSMVKSDINLTNIETNHDKSNVKYMLDLSKYHFSNNIEDIYIAELNSSRFKEEKAGNH